MPLDVLNNAGHPPSVEGLVKRVERAEDRKVLRFVRGDQPGTVVAKVNIPLLGKHDVEFSKADAEAWFGKSTEEQTALLSAALDDKFAEFKNFVDTMYAGMSPTDKAALWTAPVPIVGDAAGMLADAVHYIQDPDSRTLGNGLITLMSAAPLVPNKRLLDQAEQVKKNIQAWHGSPHRFDAFSMRHIGSGEGAQAFGHGLYFAGDKRLGQRYRDQLSQNTFTKADGTIFDPYGEGVLLNKNIRANLLATDGDLDAAMEKAKGIMARMPDTEGAKTASRDLRVLQDLKAGGGIKPHTGALYDVSLSIDPDEMLDWDKPITEQSDLVKERLENAGYYNRADEQLRADLEAQREALASARDPVTNRMLEEESWHELSKQIEEINLRQPPRQTGMDLLSRIQMRNRSGMDFIDPAWRRAAQNAIDAGEDPVQVLQSAYSDVKPAMAKLVARSLRLGDNATAEHLAAQELLEAGIPGIRYLDAFSRGAGEGSSNYVVFDDSLININSVE